MVLKRAKSVKTNEEFPKTNVSKTFSWPVKVWVLLRNEMHRGMQYGGFSCLPNLIDLDRIYIFFQNTICRNVQTKTSSKFTEFFFLEDQEINMTQPKKKNTEVSGIVEKKVQMAPV